MNKEVSMLLQLMVAHHVLVACLCAPQGGVVPFFMQEAGIRGVPLGNIEFANSQSGHQESNNSSSNSNNNINVVPPVGNTEFAGNLKGPQESSISSSNSNSNSNINGFPSLGNTEFAGPPESISSSNININVPSHPLQMLLMALMQSQNSAPVMEGQFPGTAPNTGNTFLNRIGAHIMGIAEQHMLQTSETPLPFVIVASTTPLSVDTLSNANIIVGKGANAVPPSSVSPKQLLSPSLSLTTPSSVNTFSNASTVLGKGSQVVPPSSLTARQLLIPSSSLTVPSTETVPKVKASSPISITPNQGTRAVLQFAETPAQRITPSSSLRIPSGESLPVVTAVDYLEPLSQVPIASLKKSTATKPDSVNNLPLGRLKSSLASLKKIQGKKKNSIGKLPKLKNPTADDAVERRKAMIAKVNKNKNIATTTVKVIPNKKSKKPSISQSFKPSTPILTKTNDAIRSEPIFGSNFIVSRANIIDSIVATSQKSNINSRVNKDPQTTTFASRNLDVSSTLSDANKSGNTSGKRFQTAIPVRSESTLDFSQLFRRVAHAAVKATTVAAAEARGENVGHIVSIMPLEQFAALRT